MHNWKQVNVSRSHLTGLAAAMVMVGLFAAPASAALQDRKSKPPLIMTSSGKIQGLRTSTGTFAYLGIPYAEPPVGRRRFLPPMPIRPLPDIINATKYGKASIQTTGDGKGADLSQQSEDSLNLNIWTQSSVGRKPVMVWIHGGGNWQGSSREESYDGDRLASNGGVVVVSLNYRLGILGFVDVSTLGGPEYASSANDGILDQKLALEWVKDNITKFGGDPNNITVFGNSAGSVDISALLSTDHPEELFRRAILQSGFANTAKSLKASQQFSQKIFAKGNIHSLDDLLAKTPAELIDLQNSALADMREIERDESFQPTVDGHFLNAWPQKRIEQGSAKGVDILLGSTENEIRLYLLWDPKLNDQKPEDMSSILGVSADRLRSLARIYAQSRPAMTTGQVSMDIASDIVFRIPGIRLAEAELRYNSNVYMYLFDWQAAAPSLGSPHAVELPFVFGDRHGGENPFIDWKSPKTAKSAMRLTSQVQDYWTSFARTGVPKAAGGPVWRRFDTDKRFTMRLGADTRLVSDPARSERLLYKDNSFEGR